MHTNNENKVFCAILHRYGVESVCGFSSSVSITHPKAFREESVMFGALTNEPQ